MNPDFQLSTMFSKIINFASNGNLLTGSFMTIDQYKRFYPLFVFDLSKQKNLEADLKLEFKYLLSGLVAEEYSWKATIISEGEIFVDNIKGSATISMS